MPLTPSKINTFLLLKLPSAWITGVRIKNISKEKCTTAVRLRWINQNPFKSMFWAVQGMAAELATGALVMQAIQETKAPISMLVAQNKAEFHKKAKGRITFQCEEGTKVAQAIETALQTGEGTTIWLQANGTDVSGTVVSSFAFEWTIKKK